MKIVLTWWANHGQLLEWMAGGGGEEEETTNELHCWVNSKYYRWQTKLHGSAFSGQCNLLAQHGAVAQ